MCVSGQADDDVAFQWIKEAIDITNTWDNLIDSGEGFVALDLGLPDALAAFFPDCRAHANEQPQNIYVMSFDQPERLTE